MAEWDTAYINDLPDSAFACIDAGGEKDEEGKTVPRSLRHYPHHNSAGEVDLPHLRNARARVSQDDTTSCGADHLEEHELPSDDESRSAEVASNLTIRNHSKREVDVRIMPWDIEIDTAIGRERFARGAFDGTPPDAVLLMGLEHEVHMGLGQDGTVIPTRRPIGKSRSLDDRDDGQYATFKVANTAAGDEYLAMIEDGLANGVSVEFRTVPGGTDTEVNKGRRVQIHRRVDLRAVAPTYQPAYAEARVLAFRSQEEAVMAEDKAAVAAKKEEPAPPEPDKPEPEPIQTRAIDAALVKLDGGLTKIAEDFSERIAKLEEQTRMSFNVPGGEAEPKPRVGKWMETALRLLSGERVTDGEYRTVADMITSENVGVVPPSYTTELIGVIDASRPFLSSTRRLNTPAAGMSMVVPKITERPTTGVQSTEKSELSSNDTTITTETFNAITIGGVGDISLQLLKRSDPSFLELYIQLLAEAYAIDCETEALRDLFDEIGGGITGASALDPANLSLGAAYQTSFDAIRRPPDTIWLSTEAVGEFIDAKASTTNTPLYSNITANATAGGGVTGTIQGLRVVHVPALDTHGAFALVGPSSGFAWAEDGTYTLQVDVPSKAGRDVALVGMLWFAPWYPEAFVAYNVAS